MTILILTASVGLTWLLKYGTILDRPRRFLVNWKPHFFSKLFTCSMCLGFWSGVFVGAAAYVHLGVLSVLVPFAASGLSWFADTYIEWIQIRASLDDHVYRQEILASGAHHSNPHIVPPHDHGVDTPGCSQCGKPPAPPDGNVLPS